MTLEKLKEFEDKIEDLKTENERLEIENEDLKTETENEKLEIENEKREIEDLTDALLVAYPEARDKVHPVTGEGSIAYVIRLLKERPPPTRARRARKSDRAAFLSKLRAKAL